MEKNEYLDISKQSTSLVSCSFQFEQEGNCIDGGEEQLTIEMKCDGLKLTQENAFYVIKTEQWSFDSIDELKSIIDRVSLIIENK